jgi:hypothetical protein
MPMLARISLLSLFALSSLATATHADFIIDLNFGDGLTLTQQAVFSTAKNTWEDIITGYRSGPNPLPGGALTIDASGVAIDGVNGVLGRAGPTAGGAEGGFFYAAIGIMEFDTADLFALEVSGELLDVILHEMAHVIGFGTLWDFNNVYVPESGEYTGAAALAEYKVEFDNPDATFIPVELNGGPGTANAHWNEEDFGNELMTGFISGPTYISDMTIGSFFDIGYTVDYTANDVSAVPEPSTVVLLSLTCWMVRLQRRKI